LRLRVAHLRSYWIAPLTDDGSGCVAYVRSHASTLAPDPLIALLKTSDHRESYLVKSDAQVGAA